MSASWAMGTTAAAASGYTTPTVSLSATNVTKEDDVVITYANLQYNTSGVEYQNASTGDNFSTSRGNWVDSGDAGGAWLEYTINSGSLYTNPGGASPTRLQMDTTRSFRVRDTNVGAGGVACDLDIEMWDAASGGSSLGTANVVLTATYFNACPLCCFTPDTLVTMGDGSTKPIVEIKLGDSIRTYDGLEEVTEIIPRNNRPMWRIEIEDGRTLILSVDHPIFVKGKGYSCISSSTAYKDLNETGKLEEGDHIKLESGILLRVMKMEPYEYLSTVYTLGNSRWYANGILVY